jgi:CBS domain-containing protein
MPNADPLELKGLSEIGDYASREIRTIGPDATIHEAGRLMAKYNIGSLLVQENGAYVGILTDTDLARKGTARGVNPEAEKVKSLMSSPIITIESHRTVEEAQAFMKSKGVRHLGITEDGKIVGVVTLSDIVRYYTTFFVTSE